MSAVSPQPFFIESLKVPGVEVRIPNGLHRGSQSEVLCNEISTAGFEKFSQFAHSLLFEFEMATRLNIEHTEFLDRANDERVFYLEAKERRANKALQEELPKPSTPRQFHDPVEARAVSARKLNSPMDESFYTPTTTPRKSSVRPAQCALFVTRKASCPSQSQDGKRVFPKAAPRSQSTTPGMRKSPSETPKAPPKITLSPLSAAQRTPRGAAPILPEQNVQKAKGSSGPRNSYSGVAIGKASAVTVRPNPPDSSRPLCEMTTVDEFKQLRVSLSSIYL